ncbi:MAG TPA: hypothetical protein VHD83_08510 [Puia sp.]|nr:hypothetical protein [Puia sp.]
MRASITETTDTGTGQTAASVEKPAVEKEAGLDVIVENFDEFVWSIKLDLQYIVLNTVLRKKLKELVAAEGSVNVRRCRGYLGQWDGVFETNV